MLNTSYYQSVDCKCIHWFLKSHGILCILVGVNHIIKCIVKKMLFLYTCLVLRYIKICIMFVLPGKAEQTKVIFAVNWYCIIATHFDVWTWLYIKVLCWSILLNFIKYPGVTCGIWIYIICHVWLVGQPSILLARQKLRMLVMMSKIFIHFLVIPAMFMGIIDFYHITSIFNGLDLGWGWQGQQKA